MVIQYKQEGHYFRDIRNNLMGKRKDFPADDPSPNLQECLDCNANETYTFNGLKQYGFNLVRAEMLAKQHNLSPEIIIQIQELAILQYIWDFNNDIGLRKLLENFKITPAELTRIMDLIKQEKEYPLFSYSHSTEDSSQLDQRMKGTLDWYKRFYENL